MDNKAVLIRMKCGFLYKRYCDNYMRNKLLYRIALRNSSKKAEFIGKIHLNGTYFGFLSVV